MASRFGRMLIPKRGFASMMDGPSATAGEHGGMKTWRNMTIFLAVPGILVTFFNARMKEAEYEHLERPEFVPYEFLYKRAKPFPWGDGNHTLFHNKHCNALPDGYED